MCCQRCQTCLLNSTTGKLPLVMSQREGTSYLFFQAQCLLPFTAALFLCFVLVFFLSLCEPFVGVQSNKTIIILCQINFFEVARMNFNIIRTSEFSKILFQFDLLWCPSMLPN